MKHSLPIVLGILVAATAFASPLLHYRVQYDTFKRLRVVTDGRFYRSGQLTAEGFREAHRKYGFKTVINLQEDFRDPPIPERPFAKPTIPLSALFKSMDVKYVSLDGGTLDESKGDGDKRPIVLDQYLELLDDPENYPILIHCKAGLHRTGLMTAVYRMEYEKRSVAEAVEELRANGFGTFAATDANAYMRQLVAQYRPGVRWPNGKPEAR